jgi:hypothetical protein
MPKHVPVRFRALTIVALALGALMASSGLAAAADPETGQHGNYVYKDNETTYGATCVYSGSGPYKLTQVVVKPPSLWWWDSNAANNRQHGMVGWQTSLQISRPGSDGPWNTLFSAPTLRRVAFEDHPTMDPADKANLPRMTLLVNHAYTKYPNAYARVMHEAFWFGRDGSTKGTVTHLQVNYAWQNVPGMSGSTGGCPIHYSAPV